MDYSTRTGLINALANEFDVANSFNVNTSNYIDVTNAMDCTALGLEASTLEKTSKMISDQIAKINTMQNSAEASQCIAHLVVAKKCVEEIISIKRKRVVAKIGTNKA